MDVYKEGIDAAAESKEEGKPDEGNDGSPEEAANE